MTPSPLAPYDLANKRHLPIAQVRPGDAFFDGNSRPKCHHIRGMPEALPLTHPSAHGCRTFNDTYHFNGHIAQKLTYCTELSWMINISYNTERIAHGCTALKSTIAPTTSLIPTTPAAYQSMLSISSNTLAFVLAPRFEFHHMTRPPQPSKNTYMRHPPDGLSPQRSAPFFPSSKAALRIDGNIITSNIEKHVRLQREGVALS